VKRLQELCAELDLPDDAEPKLATLLGLLDSDPTAPTSVTAPAEAVDVHIADSLAALPSIAEHARAGPVVDIGSGAGFPGLPLAIARPDCEFDLLESTGRKCSFLERAIERARLPNARVVCARVEDWARGQGGGRYALALVRAVGPLATLVEYASPLLHEGGLLVAWKGARDALEEAQGAAAAQALGMSPLAVVPVTPFQDARHRHLHLFEKTGPAPVSVPRRAGMASKRPFGGESSAPN
jgi:16S rRNA (guanine527-N7)-methyltransferase